MQSVFGVLFNSLVCVENTFLDKITRSSRFSPSPLQLLTETGKKMLTQQNKL